MYKDPQRDTDERMEDLLARASRVEKLRQLSCVPSSALAREGVFDPELAEVVLGEGIGQVRLSLQDSAEPEQTVVLVGAIQEFLAERTRLGIPALIQACRVGSLAAGGGGVFPPALGCAATFNPALVREMAQATRRAFLAVGARQALAPVLDVARDPRWEGFEETYGEDPYLVGRLGVAFVRGLQGDNLQQAVLATAREFLASGLGEGGLPHGPVQLGERELREVYAEPFAAAIREAGLHSVMTGSNAVDGLACTGAEQILDGLLRAELGFRGTVIAADHGVEQLIHVHRIAADRAAAARQALAAGVDVEFPGMNCYGAPLEEQLEAGRVTDDVVERSVSRVLRQKFALGLFDVVESELPAEADTLEAPGFRLLTRRLAEQSVVLLENDGVLPLSKGCRVTLMSAATDAASVARGDPPEALMHALANCCDLRFEPLTRHVRTTGPDRVAISEALGVADVLLLWVERDGPPGWASGDGTDTLDPADLQPEAEFAAIKQLASRRNVPVVVVLGGNPSDAAATAQRANATLITWLRGVKGGSTTRHPTGSEVSEEIGSTGARAVADVLFGDVNPSARLPVSLPPSGARLPLYFGRRAGAAASVDHHDAAARALYPFGFGLSYSAFEYGELVCPHTVDTHGAVDVAVTVSNVSNISGEEVVQLYLHDKVANVTRPVKQLAGFARVLLEPGQSRTVQFDIDATQLAYFNRTMEYVVEPGEVEIMVGSSSEQIHSRCVLMVQGDTRPLKQQQRVATQAQVVDPLPDAVEPVTGERP